MSTTIVATQHSFDEMLEQVRRTLLHTESVEGQMDTVQTKTPLHEQLEHWGLSPWPSDERMKKANLGGRRLEEGDPDVLHLHAWIEQVESWLHAHASPIDNPKELRAINRTYSSMVKTPISGIDDVLKINRAMWEKYRVLAPPNGMWGGSETWMRPHKAIDIPDFVRARYNLPSRDETPSNNLTRSPITPAFRHDGREGLGRISSSQISLALFTACVAPKSEWSATTKGFPRYVFTVPSGEIVIMLTPEVIVRGDMADQVAAMNKIRDDLSVDDWDLLTILMEQVFAEGHSDASAFITDDAALDYRQIEQKKLGRYKIGHRPRPRARIDACLNRVAHLHIRTDTLHILEDTGKGKPHKVVFDCNEKVIKIKGDITRRDDDATMGWSYEFGKTFTTFLHRPNNYVGYLLQGTVALDGRKETAKQLAHYLTLHTRIDAHNGRGMERFMGELIDGAKLPHNPSRPQRTIDDTEDALREVVRAGLYRFEHGGEMFDADSADLDAWTALPKNAKGYGLLKTWQQQKVVIRAEPDIEARYDRYRRSPR